MPQVIDTPGALFAATQAARAGAHRIGLVPTMGALHDGHMSLVQAARAAGATQLVVSIFVNPLQFGAGEDLDAYPRTLEADLALCERHGVDLVYTPSVASMYPPGFQTHVEVEQITARLEGRARPHHFRGVTTVVTKLLTATGPCIAAFGRKDYQQWRVIEQLVRDLNLPVQVLGCPIVREADGLALSSRNRYLDPQERVRARALSRGLGAASQAFARGERSVAALEAAARRDLQAHCDGIDYVSIADARTLDAFSDIAADASVMLVAALIGRTRLIDNCALGQECLNLPSA